MDKVFRAWLLYFPILLALGGWLLIVLGSVIPYRQEPALIPDLLILIGYPLAGLATSRVLGDAPLPPTWPSDKPEAIVRFLMALSGLLILIGMIWQMTIPYGLMFLDAVAIYAGTILYAVIFYPSVYSLLHPVPKLRKLILSSAAVYSFLAVLFLLFTLFAYRGFL